MVVDTTEGDRLITEQPFRQHKTVINEQGVDYHSAGYLAPTAQPALTDRSQCLVQHKGFPTKETVVGVDGFYRIVPCPVSIVNRIHPPTADQTAAIQTTGEQPSTADQTSSGQASDGETEEASTGLNSITIQLENRGISKQMQLMGAIACLLISVICCVGILLMSRKKPAPMMGPMMGPSTPAGYSAGYSAGSAYPMPAPSYGYY